MATASDIIQAAFEQIQVYAAGETVANVDFARGLYVLNTMIDSWSNESLSCYAILEQSGTLVPGQYQYTVGPGGNFSGPRPLGLITGPGAAYILDGNGVKYNLEILSQDQWNLIAQLSNIDSNIPTQLFYDPQYPLGIMNFYPTPNTTVTAFWDSNLQVAEFSSLNTPMSFPLGYQKALQDNLAVELSMYYPTAVVSPILIKAAARSLGNIKRVNTRPFTAYYDPELVSKAQGTYNIYTDNQGRG